MLPSAARLVSNRKARGCSDFFYLYLLYFKVTDLHGCVEVTVNKKSDTNVTRDSAIQMILKENYS